MRFIGIMMVAATVAVTGAVAQTNTVDQRKENQQDRVAQGIKSGQLTAGETANLETKEAAINQEVRTDRTLNGGRLTNQEKQTVNRQQNRMSKQIYADKHNAATQPAPKSEVGARRENQQDRIASGVASGKLSAGQTAKLEKGETAINKEVKADRSANGGKLTAAEKKQVNKQQNKMSGKIYRDKH
jgi:metal-dependent amidase/aminoacylase/carboxypeptidase family protein